MTKPTDTEKLRAWIEEKERWLAMCTVMPGGDDILSDLTESLDSGELSVEPCKWNQDGAYHITSCGVTTELSKHKGHQFCPYCGGELVEDK